MEINDKYIEKKLVPAELDILHLLMEEDKNIKALLNSPSKDLPLEYSCLVGELFREPEYKTLYDVIEKSFFGLLMPDTIIQKFFLVDSKKIIGFFGYKANRGMVSNFKIFTFKPSLNDNIIPIDKLHNLFEELFTKYEKINFYTLKKNPSNKIYQEILEKYDYSIEFNEDRINYCINKLDKKRKYKFNGKSKIFKPYLGVNIILNQIVAVEDIPQHGVKKGTIGGWVESYNNLQDNAWIEGDALVMDNACVSGYAKISGNAHVSENAKISGNVQVSEDVHIYGSAQVSGDAQIYGSAIILDRARISGNVKVYGRTYISGDAQVSGDAQIYGSVRILDRARVSGNAKLSGQTFINYDERIGDGALIRSNDHHCFFSNFGHYNYTLTAYRCKNGDIRVECLFFQETLDELKRRFEEKQGDDKFAKNYLALIELIKRKFTKEHLPLK
jgi:carbonic anhydrase/acetyltransferase-like protein (isoleucine patch superfamily)